MTVGPVFVTHLHSDHTLGLPELLYLPGMPALRVYGPPGVPLLKAPRLTVADDDNSEPPRV